MLVIYGLGNNDSKYFNTKHNAGRQIVEEMANQLGLNFQKKDTFAFATHKINGVEVYFLYSLGYMNSSGEPLNSFCSYFKLDFSEPNSAVLIVQDDSDQIETAVKLLPAGGSAGHHGINSVYKNMLSLKLPMENLWRLKIGIRPPQSRLRSETFVLKSLSQPELLFYKELSTRLVSTLPLMLKSDFSRAQTSLNRSLTLDSI